MKQNSIASITLNGARQHMNHMNIPNNVTTITNTTGNLNNNNNLNENKSLKNWWNIRSNLEKLLLLTSLILSLLLTATLASFVITIIFNDNNSASYKYSHLKTSKSLISTLSEPYTCLTPGCVKSASHIIESMDTLADPCDDFYQFACGGWKETKYINEDQTGVTEFGALRENLNRKLRGQCLAWLLSTFYSICIHENSCQ